MIYQYIINYIQTTYLSNKILWYIIYTYNIIDFFGIKLFHVTKYFHLKCLSLIHKFKKCQSTCEYDLKARTYCITGGIVECLGMDHTTSTLSIPGFWIRISGTPGSVSTTRSCVILKKKSYSFKLPDLNFLRFWKYFLFNYFDSQRTILIV